MDWANILWFEVDFNLPNEETVLKKNLFRALFIGWQDDKEQRITYIYANFVKICPSGNFGG